MTRLMGRMEGPPSFVILNLEGAASLWLHVDSSGKKWHEEETEDQNRDVGGYVGRRTAANGGENATITVKAKQSKPPSKNKQNREEKQREPKVKSKNKTRPRK